MLDPYLLIMIKLDREHKLSLIGMEIQAKKLPSRNRYRAESPISLTD